MEYYLYTKQNFDISRDRKYGKRNFQQKIHIIILHFYENLRIEELNISMKLSLSTLLWIYIIFQTKINNHLKKKKRC